MRSLLLAAFAGTLAAIPAVRSEEPLFLRIRPNAESSASAGASDEARAARALAAREAVWARSDARARIAIASVCTGCMKPMRPAPVPPSRGHTATDSASRSALTSPSDSAAPPAAPLSPATLLATAGEP